MCDPSITADDSKSLSTRCMQYNYIHMYMRIYFLYSEGISRDLGVGEIQLFKPVCKKLGLPLQPPVTVETLNSKKVTIIDKPTGRAIVYTLCDTDASGFPSIVSLDQSVLTFGKLYDIFSYREIKFASVKKIKCTISNFYGLRRLSNCIDDDSVILSIHEISRPLAYARSGLDIWILNHHT